MKHGYHLALVQPKYRPDGGAEQILSRILTALQGEDMQITVVSRNWQAADLTNDARELLKCDPFYVGRLWREWSFARAACRALRDLDTDLVQAQVRIPCCDIYRAGGGVHREWLRQRDRMRGWRGRIGTSLSLFHRFKLRQERDLYQSPKLKAVICNSRMVADEIRRDFNFPEDKIHVIYNGVDLDRFRPDADPAGRARIRSELGIGDGDTAFVFVGSGFERKGLASAIRAFSRLPEDSHLIAVGQDKRPGHYRRLAQRLGVADRVHLVGKQINVVAYYSAADVFVLPTLYDPFANATLEAFACGLPVLTSEKCGAVDLIRTGENGYVCDALDWQTLSRQMDAVRDPQTRARIGRAGRATVEPLSLETMGRNLTALYQRLMAESAKPD